MKFFLKILPIIFLISSSQIFSNSCDCELVCPCTETQTCLAQENSCCNVFGKSFYASRSQGNNRARNMMGIQEKIHKFGVTDFYGVATAALEYERNFRNQGIGTWFTTNGSSSMTYGMEYVQDETSDGIFDINSINFGVTGSGTISFCPTKDDIIFDLFVYLGFDKILCGTWASLQIPIVHSRWDLHLQETVEGDSTTYYPLNSVGDNLVNNVFNVAKPMTEAFKGAAFGDAPALKYGKICVRKDTTDIPGLEVLLGYDAVRCPYYHFAIAADFVVPTGTQPRGEYLFEPIVGDQDRWQAGLNINVGWNCWSNACDTNTISIFLDATVNHLFAHKNRRILGINIPNATDTQKNWSYYLLLKKFDNSDQATGLERATNIFTGDVKIKANVVGNVTLLLQWNCNCLMSGIGYEFWGRSKEIMEYRCFNIMPNTYAIKGSTEWNGDNTDTDNNKVAPTTTISTNGTVQDVTDSVSYLTNDMFYYCPALHPSTYSNKVFGFIGYNCCDGCFQPFVLVSGEAEFGENNRAFSQWGIILKGGLCY